MNIKGYGEVSAIRLKHNGCEMNMEHIMPIVYKENATVNPSTIAFLEFKDTMEIEMMIYMLNEFKQVCIRGMGKWE